MTDLAAVRRQDARFRRNTSLCSHRSRMTSQAEAGLFSGAADSAPSLIDGPSDREKSGRPFLHPHSDFAAARHGVAPHSPRAVRSTGRLDPTLGRTRPAVKSPRTNDEGRVTWTTGPNYTAERAHHRGPPPPLGHAAPAQLRSPDRAGHSGTPAPRGRFAAGSPVLRRMTM
jgi:hypothetical protein